MSAEQTAYTLLSGDTDITALTSDRIYPDFVPQEKTVPAIAITRTDTEYVTTIHSGAVQAALVTLEVWCLAATRLAADALADQVLVTLGQSPGGFMPGGRRPETDAGPPVNYATVLTMMFWE